MNTPAFPVSVLRRTPLSLSDHSAKPRCGRPLDITTASPETARRLGAALKALGHHVRLVEVPGADCGMAVFTEGMIAAPSATFHWAVLRTVQRAVERLSMGEARTVFLQRSGGESGPWCAGLAGLARTITREYPGHWSQTLSFETGDTVSDAAFESAAHCLGAADSGDFAMISEAGDVHTLSPETVETYRKAAVPQVTSRDVFLVTGGGQGITAACTIALAKRTQARFILLGRTQPVFWPQWLDPSASETDVRAALARTALSVGERPAPRDLARRARTLLASRAVQQTLTAIQHAGGDGVYVSVDLADAASVAVMAQRVKAEHGAITGLIHGAGVLSDHRLMDMTEAHVDAVFGPKVNGLRALLAACPPRSLRHIALFSSAAAHFGNAGQANYAMANQVLIAAAHQMKADHPEANIRSFGWGPWDGGMVSDALKAAFSERGIRTLPVADGANLFADLMLSDLDGVDLSIGAI